MVPALNGQGGLVIDAISNVLVLARWLHFASVMLVFGGSLFWLYEGQDSAGLPWTARTMGRINRAAVAVAAFSGIAWLVATIAYMTGDFAGIIDHDTLHAFFLETSFGPLEVSRLGLLAVLVALGVQPGRTTVRFTALAAVSGVLLVSQAWLGHAAEGGSNLYGAAMILAYAAHLLAAGAWLGGLLPLILAIVERRRQTGPGGGTLHVLSRYSVMAAAAVGVIVLSGIANTIFHAGGTLKSLVFSTYGKVLLAKLSLVAVMLALAAVNRLILMPHLKGVGGPRSQTLEKVILLEGVCGLLVLGAAAMLGITPPPQRSAGHQHLIGIQLRAAQSLACSYTKRMISLQGFPTPFGAS